MHEAVIWLSVSVVSILILMPAVPLSWSLGAFIVGAHFDAATAEHTSATAIQGVNAWRVLILPIALWLKSAWLIGSNVSGFRRVRFWAWWLLVGYVALATSWSPLQLAGLKQVGYMLSYSFLGVAAYRAFRVSRADFYPVVSWSILAILAVGVVQSWILGNQWGGGEGRFTTFTAAQSFGLALPLGLGLLLATWHREARGIPVTALCVGVIAAGLLNGSRAGLIGILIILLSWLAYHGWVTRSRRFASAALSLVMAGASLGAASILTLSTFRERLVQDLENRRAWQVVSVALGATSFESIGTLAWRLGMYEVLVNEIAKRGGAETIQGRGTSSAGVIVTSGLYAYRNYDDRTIDANRIAHNEWLRATYEWGLIGLLLVSAVALTIWRAGGSAYIAQPGRETFLFRATILVLLLYSFFENLLAAPASPVGSLGMIVVSRALASGD